MGNRSGQGPPPQGYGVPPQPLPKPLLRRIDPALLAVALDNVDRDYDRGWTPAHYARAIAAEYQRLASESSPVEEPEQPEAVKR